MDSEIYTMDMEVRDHECDMAGMVNNAHFLHYLEHARFCFLRAHGIDFQKYAREGIALVAKRIEVDYIAPLRSTETFTISVRLERISPLRYVFEQAIHRCLDRRLILQARVIGTAINRQGRPEIPHELEQLLAPCVHDCVDAPVA